MNSRWIFLPFLIVFFFSQSLSADETEWTEKRLGKVSTEAAQKASRRIWSQAIRLGEQMLTGSAALNKKSDDRYINFLKTVNRYYDKAGRLSEIEGRVIEAYELSSKHLDKKHLTSRINRLLYYKVLIENKNYLMAINIVQENIEILDRNREDDYKRLTYLKQLYSLYRMTGQLENEEKTLVEYLSISRNTFKTSDEFNMKVILNLVNNYCQQQKLTKFNELILQHNLKYSC